MYIYIYIYIYTLYDIRLLHYILHLLYSRLYTIRCRTFIRTGYYDIDIDYASYTAHYTLYPCIRQV